MSITPQYPFGLLWRAAAALLLVGWACNSDESSTSLPPGEDDVRLELVAGGFGFSTDIQAPPGDPRLFVVGKDGQIRIIKDGARLERPFLDVARLVSRGGEQGLLAMAFPPDYAASGRFYIHYTDTDGNTVVARYRVSADADSAVASSAQVVFTQDQPFSNHNGGQLRFGPDGFLYLGLGDGGSGGDPHGNGQDLGTPLGKLLRFDVSGTGPARAADGNPFEGTAGARPEIWSYGLRNPWRFAFDRANGDLYIADVGQGRWEEVDVSPAGQGAGRGVNYGWNRMEGPDCYPSGSSCDRDGLASPAHAYGHGDGCSITGGYVYRGAAIPNLAGRYFYSDYCGGWVRSFRWNGSEAVEHREWPTLEPPTAVATFGEDAAGELYLAGSNGRVYRIAPAAAGP